MRSTTTSSAEPDLVLEGEPDSVAGRPMRADARRNRDALLAAAAELFADHGVDAPLEEIARRAGVGIGTLYRHFPTRDALTEAVYRNELERLCAGVDELLRSSAPDVALALWMRNFIGSVATKRGMAAALRAVLGPNNDLFAYSHRRVREAMRALLDAAARAGVIRADVDADDLIRALGGLCAVPDGPRWRERASRITDLLVDGLRYGAKNAADSEPGPSGA